MTTWKDIKIFTLQKMFSITGDTLKEDSSTVAYIKSMPQVANEGLLLLATAGKNIIKSLTVQAAKADAPLKVVRMRDLVSDFYSFGSNKAYIMDQAGYRQKTDCMKEGADIILLPVEDACELKIYYNAYPKLITKETPDDELIEMDPEAVVILPLYMASQLYKDDDAGLSAVWRNEFEVAREALIQEAAGPSAAVSAKFRGW